MNKITSLTAAQQARFPEFVQKWTDIGLSTAPANRSEAERGIRLAYQMAGLEAPKQIVWCGSPLTQGLTRAIVLGLAEGKIKIPKTAGPGTDPGELVWASVGDSVWASVWASVGASVWASVGDSVGASGYGAHDSNWLGFYDYFAEVCNLDEHTQKLSGLWLVAKNAGWFLPHRNICWISERHNVLRRDEQGRLHCEDGPALSYPDGFSIWAWHGVRVSQDLIEKPDTITLTQIKAETNAEIRRIMIERYGMARYLVDAGAKAVHRDDYGTLYRQEVPGDEPIVMVKVLNSTAEPDGQLTRAEALKEFSANAPVCHDGLMIPLGQAPASLLFKPYFIRVPPTTKRAKEAVAWTFGKTEEAYAPLMQS